MRVRSIWCTIWVLGALLVIATLDNRRDPPATNPGVGQCKLSKSLCQRVVSDGSALQCCVALITPVPLPIHFIAADACPSGCPGNRMVLTEQAGGPSPPEPH